MVTGVNPTKLEANGNITNYKERSAFIKEIDGLVIKSVITAEQAKAMKSEVMKTYHIKDFKQRILPYETAKILAENATSDYVKDEAGKIAEKHEKAKKFVQENTVAGLFDDGGNKTVKNPPAENGNSRVIMEFKGSVVKGDPLKKMPKIVAEDFVNFYKSYGDIPSSNPKAKAPKFEGSTVLAEAPDVSNKGALAALQGDTYDQLMGTKFEAPAAMAGLNLTGLGEDRPVNPSPLDWPVPDNSLRYAQTLPYPKEPISKVKVQDYSFNETTPIIEDTITSGKVGGRVAQLARKHFADTNGAVPKGAKFAVKGTFVLSEDGTVRELEIAEILYIDPKGKRETVDPYLLAIVQADAEKEIVNQPI